MPYEISEIKHIRKKLGLTQSELAKRADVSQSLIAKMEAGSLDPTYSNAKKIFNALDSIARKKELKAWEIMETKIVFADPEETAADVVKKMKRYEISQLPVVEGNSLIGIVSESILLYAILNNKKGAIREIMEDAPPLVSKDASIVVVSDLLRHYPLVVVAEKGRLKGIITKSDLLRKVFNK
ncbi:hypothetical protein COV19_01215 [Candidatus Woesearchaeota archaeon CG10_big_fil_rev_8_21_14_0_10_44_13]|nr:MAG: hypothetical protein COV19_01215 [Candidatus Woesearchaeota archaeon CG10_big_fil_rev_8_21_14_0_10_44_13]